MSQASLFKNKVMNDMGIIIRSIPELQLPSNHLLQTPCPHTFSDANSFLSE